jgi:hypothetical protein
VLALLAALPALLLLLLLLLLHSLLQCLPCGVHADVDGPIGYSPFDICCLPSICTSCCCCLRVLFVLPSALRPVLLLVQTFGENFTRCCRSRCLLAALLSLHGGVLCTSAPYAEDNRAACGMLTRVGGARGATTYNMWQCCYHPSQQHNTLQVIMSFKPGMQLSRHWCKY